MMPLGIRLSIRHTHNGFTLIEMLISLAIFALIGVSAYQVLASSALVSEREQKRTESMHELDRALRIIERDLRQVVDRQVRDEFSPRHALHGSPDDPLEFTRAGNENPLRLARSDLLRVMYVLREPEATEQQENNERRDNTEDTLHLLRTLTRMPDSSAEALVNEQLLLSAVIGFTVLFMDADLSWHDAWPLPPGQGANADSNPDDENDVNANANPNANVTALPAAIKVTLNIAGTGELTRVISLR